MSKITNYVTTNKSDRNVNKQFDQKQFNAKFEEQEKINEQEKKLKNSEDLLNKHEIINNNLPHKKPVEDVIINIRELFYKIIELLLDKKNPFPYIFSTPDRQFAFSIFLIIIGSLLLLLSNLMKS
jgi:hypothetical protein